MHLKNCEKNVLKRKFFVNFYYIILSQFDINHD